MKGQAVELVHYAYGAWRVVITQATLWHGTTVYPRCVAWQLWWHERPVVLATPLLMMTAEGVRGAGAQAVWECQTQTEDQGAARGLVEVALTTPTGMELRWRLCLTAQEARWGVVRGACQGATPLVAALWPPASYNLRGTRLEASQGGEPVDFPLVFFAPTGLLLTTWTREGQWHLRVWRRPGAWAAQRLALQVAPAKIHLVDAVQGCRLLFETAPWWAEQGVPQWSFDAALTPGFRLAWELIFADRATVDDYWVMRGEPGQYAVVALRRGAQWQVAMVSAMALTLTVRLEDLWLRLAPELRAAVYELRVQRDPNAREVASQEAEAGVLLVEQFTAVTPKTKLVLDIAAGGGARLLAAPGRQSGHRHHAVKPIGD